jgi:2-dehydro-3-deoxyphosphooctonate aldolase (KDO 8-P synthase)
MRIIAGPCQHESLSQSAHIAQRCKEVCDKYGVEYYFKASYDKANRSSMQGKRGVGLETTMHDFKTIKEVHGVQILTDVHDIKQVALLEHFNVVDVYQIPAFLCRQTDLLQAACATNKIVNIKKGQFLAPWDMKGILSKTEGAREVWITERGTSFGYNTLVVDFTGLDYMLNNYDYPVVLDATHSVPGLCRAGSALGIRNFFLEVHPNPDNAPSDGPNMLRLDDFEKVVADIVAISKVVG